MASTTIEKRKYTYEAYLKTPDDERYELIGGELLITPAPVPKHQRISRKIEFLLDKFVTEKDLGEVFYAPCDVHLDDEEVYILKDSAYLLDRSYSKNETLESPFLTGFKIELKGIF